MREGWKEVSFEKSIEKVKKQTSVKSKDYKEKGLFPIVSQESSLISGYYDDETLLYQHQKPVVIFGDHTKNIKYIDFDFIVGADGVHILSPIKELNPKFFYYQLCSIKLRHLGYARHYKLLKECNIAIPSLEEQHRIVELLDAEFAKIDAIKANAEKQLQDAKDLFQSALKDLLTPKEGWDVKTLGMISNFSQGVQVEVGKQSVENKDGFMRFLRIVDFTQGNEPPRYVSITDKKYQVKRDSLSIVRYGASAGFICTGIEGVIANNIFKVELKSDILISNAYLYYVLISDIFQSVIKKNVNGVAMPALSFGMIKDVDIPYPTVDEQKNIVLRLDKIRGQCNVLQVNYEKTISLCNDLKQSLLKDIFG